VVSCICAWSQPQASTLLFMLPVQLGSHRHPPPFPTLLIEMVSLLFCWDWPRTAILHLPY
jgi:hypothetical protein